MTNEEAIRLLENAPIMGIRVKDSPLPLAQAVRIAISSLERQKARPANQFIELTVLNTLNKVAVNVEKIEYIIRNGERASLYFGDASEGVDDEPLRVKESYEEVLEKVKGN